MLSWLHPKEVITQISYDRWWDILPAIVTVTRLVRYQRIVDILFEHDHVQLWLQQELDYQHTFLTIPGSSNIAVSIYGKWTLHNISLS